MFYRIIKEFFLKKVVSKGLLGYKLEDSGDKIDKIGVVVDISYFSSRELILNELKSSGVNIDFVEILVFKDKIKAKENLQEPYFSLQDITLSGKISKETVQGFIDKPFDLLINYYDEPKAALNMIAKKSKAKFKVGFTTIDKRINHLSISTDIEKTKEFVTEMVKYLRILNKI